MSDGTPNTLIQLLQMLIDANEASRKRAEISGFRAAQVNMYEKLDKSLRDTHAEIMTLLKCSTQVTAGTFAVPTQRLMDAIVQFVKDSTDDYLSGRTLTPAEAAVPGGLIYDALNNVRMTAEELVRWADERFHRSTMNKLLHRPYLHVGPAEVTVRLATLRQSLMDALDDTNRALAQFGQPHHPLKYLLLLLSTPQTGAAITSHIEDSSSPSETSETSELHRQPERQPPLSAPIYDMQRMYNRLIDLAKRIIGMAERLLLDLKKATRPGGGIDPRVAKQSAAAAVKLCAIGLREVDDRIDRLTRLDANIVDAG